MRALRTVFVLFSAFLAATVNVAIAAPGDTRPWMDASKSPDERARLVVASMTQDEKLVLLSGIMALPLRPGEQLPPGAEVGAGYIEGIPRLGVPALTETDASLGIASALNVRKQGATPLPASLALAATFNTDLAFKGGAMIADEARRNGFNVLLAGGVNLARDPRAGRNFEYLGEDPLLAGVMAGESIRGIQSQHIIATVKHFALNDQETGRSILSANIADAAARESDLLAFQLAIERGQPGSVMCAYNRVNRHYACDSDYLLNQVLKRDWKFPGWVMSDWGAVRRLETVLNGLDQQSGRQIDKQVWFQGPLKQAAASDARYRARIDEMNRRILRSMFAAGVFEHPPVKGNIDFGKNAQLAKSVSDEAIVLLRNRNALLPLSKSVKSIAVIGGHADAGVMSGGGSSQVSLPNGVDRIVPMGGEGLAGTLLRKQVIHASSPLNAIKSKAPSAQVVFDDGYYPARAAKFAASAEVAIVFATQWMIEGEDAPNLSLPAGQDALIAAVVAANPNTIVVLETGNPVVMPWLDATSAVLQAWYPGAKGGDSIADILFGDVNPSGRLPITFPASERQLPRPDIPGFGRREGQIFMPSGEPEDGFDVDYDVEGSDVGYRWFARKQQLPLFSFGHGLTYTSFEYSDLQVVGGQTLTVSFTVKNTGSRAGKDAPQVYVTQRAGRAGQRLIGFSKIELAPGASTKVSLVADPRLLADWSGSAPRWHVREGTYEVNVGASANDARLKGAAKIREQRLSP
ncbi:MAG TPA: beta-glucosidase [Steroidobacteraceae bacterium]|nr:beta-glucosidase [Steroidobacteraceae bacterium]